MLQNLLDTLAADIVPAPALSALFGLGLKEATNWSLRAAGRRTTLLLVWDKEDNNEEKGTLKYRRGRGRKQRRRETGPRCTPHTPQPEVHEEPAPVEPKRIQTVHGVTLEALHEQNTVKPATERFRSGDSGCGHVTN
ncbi:hypothetical protein ACJMK2_017928 [Sinanodonta woodiana]|uniref:Uncharacterized protein n=1 Tax=Sinanodonta woodiana TaxID=1069815 RepID=A0ABD3UEU5_SINWO